MKMIRTKSISLLISTFLSAALLSTGAVAQDPTQLEESVEKQQMIELGRRYESAWDLYLTLRDEADGGTRLTWDNLPDWTGLYTRPVEHIALFDPDQPREELPTASLTPEFRERMLERIALSRQGIGYDLLGKCVPPGYPRWLTSPFLREFIVTPDQTWLITEVFNEIRRVYTDDREHIPVDDRYPTFDGDSIGFWDGDRLIVHTTQLNVGQYTRDQPDHTDQVESVERWQKVDDRNIEVDVWVYDPPALTEAWYVKQFYAKLSNEDKLLRIHYWHCFENQNNDVYETEEGRTQFRDFTFTDEDDRRIR